jgi:hypothetical protein
MAKPPKAIPNPAVPLFLRKSLRFKRFFIMVLAPPSLQNHKNAITPAPFFQ